MRLVLSVLGFELNVSLGREEAEAEGPRMWAGSGGQFERGEDPLHPDDGLTPFGFGNTH